MKDRLDEIYRCCDVVTNLLSSLPPCDIRCWSSPCNLAHCLISSASRHATPVFSVQQSNAQWANWKEVEVWSVRIAGMIECRNGWQMVVFMKLEPLAFAITYKNYLNLWKFITMHVNLWCKIILLNLYFPKCHY